MVILRAVPTMEHAVEEGAPALSYTGDIATSEWTDERHFLPLSLRCTQKAEDGESKNDELQKLPDDRNEPDEDTEDKEHDPLPRMKADEGGIPLREVHNDRQNPHIPKRRDIAIDLHILRGITCRPGHHGCMHRRLRLLLVH